MSAGGYRAAALRRITALYGIPRHVWHGIVAGPAAPLVLLAALVGLKTGLFNLVSVLAVGLIVVFPVIFVILPLIYFAVRNARKIHLLGGVLIGASIPAAMMVLFGLWQYFYMDNGSEYSSNGSYRSVDPEWTTAETLAIFVYFPLGVTPLGVVGALAGWLAAFGFRWSVDHDTLNRA